MLNSSALTARERRVIHLTLVVIGALVLIIGLFDLLAMIQSALTDPNWLGYAVEGFAFAALVYWVFCFGMSRYSMALEKKLHTGHKR